MRFRRALRAASLVPARLARSTDTIAAVLAG